MSILDNVGIFPGSFALMPGEQGVKNLGYQPGDVRRYGANLGALNNAPAINAAIVAAADFSVPFYIDGDYLVTQTIELVSGVRYMGGPGGIGTGGQNVPRSVIRWAGPINTPVVRAKDVHHVIWDGIEVDCQDVAGSVGIAYESDNAPASGQNVFQNFGIYNYVVCGFQWGTGGTTQSDFTQLYNFSLRTNNAGAVGIEVNQVNAANLSTIGPGTIQGGDKGIYIPLCGGLLRLQNVGFGALDTASIHITECVDIEINNCQSEGGAGHTFIVLDGTPFLAGTIVIQKCNFDEDVQVNKTCRIVSIGNRSLGTITFGAGLGIQVVSLNDSCLWPHSGSNNFVQRIDGRNPLVVDQGDSDIGMSFTGDHVQPAPFRFDFRTAGAVLWDLLFPCTGNVLGLPDGTVALWNRDTQKLGIAVFPDGGSDISNPIFSLADNGVQSIPNITYGRFTIAEVGTFLQIADFLVTPLGTFLVFQSGTRFSTVINSAGLINVYLAGGVLTVQNKANTGNPMIFQSKTDRIGS